MKIQNYDKINTEVKMAKAETTVTLWQLYGKGSIC